MGYKVIWSKGALADLLNICRYISERNPDAAAKFGYTLIARIAKLRYNPDVWPRFRTAKSDRVHSFRHFKYRVFYEIDEARHVVDVLRIRHGAQAPISPDQLR